MTIIDYRDNRFLITDQSDPDLVWPVNPVSNQWINVITPNMTIPMEWREGYRETLAKSWFCGCFPPWSGGSGGTDTGGGLRWIEIMLPPPGPRSFTPTGYFGPAVWAWWQSLRRALVPPEWILELREKAFVAVILIDDETEESTSPNVGRRPPRPFMTDPITELRALAFVAVVLEEDEDEEEEPEDEEAEIL